MRIIHLIALLEKRWKLWLLAGAVWTAFGIISAFATYQVFAQMGFLIYCALLAVGLGKDYYRKYREGELKAAVLISQLTQAQLQALKTQLQPHFLFNTLNSISALLHQDVQAADAMVARLGAFLRLTLD